MTVGEVHHLLGYRSAASMRNAMYRGVLDELVCFRWGRFYLFREDDVRAFQRRYGAAEMERVKTTVGEQRMRLLAAGDQRERAGVDN